ncbi:related to aminopeptidase [Rhynchosporium agropyri]|uniref:Related to aminopeptidase n=1 Tax=Rhynchosporium agropyri TaxID=914238 RepID=A0A1E1KGN9_9HELO|nr:related to aminopeptidase [Rhynchosporium agropyri]
MVRMTIRDVGYTPGQLPTGTKNSILDVKGVHVGQATVGEDGSSVRSGVTVILPRAPDDISIPCYAGMHTLNGNGEVSGSYQIKDWGFTNMPIALTNSTSFGTVFQQIWEWTLKNAREKNTSLETMSHNYGTPIVAETADWWLNDVHAAGLKPETVQEAFTNALTQKEVMESQYGGGAGMTCHHFPGGTGTSSRIVKGGEGSEGAEFTVGVLCQTNYGHVPDLQIGGVPIGKLILKEKGHPVHMPDSTDEKVTTGGKAEDGSIVIILITDAPMLPHQLARLARHCAVGLAQVGGHGVGSNFSGDIVLALSTGNAPNERVLNAPKNGISVIESNDIKIIKNESMDTMFRAASEATEESILNSLVAGRAGRTGYKGIKLDGFPVDLVGKLLQKYRVVV